MYLLLAATELEGRQIVPACDNFQSSQAYGGYGFLQ